MKAASVRAAKDCSYCTSLAIGVDEDGEDTCGDDTCTPAVALNVDGRIARAVTAATEAFWTSIAASFPEVKTGDLDPLVVSQQDAANLAAVSRWYDANERGHQ